MNARLDLVSHQQTLASQKTFEKKKANPFGVKWSGVNNSPATGIRSWNGLETGK